MTLAKLENAMALVVVDPCSVVQLGGSQADSVVRRRRKHQKIVVAQETFHDFIVSRGRAPKFEGLGAW